MNLLSKSNTKATFFVLAKILEDSPEIIKEIIDEGHEISCHTYSHQQLYNMTPESFDAEIGKCVQLLKDNFNREYVGFRAPFFSVDQRSWWVLDILKKMVFNMMPVFILEIIKERMVGFRKKIFIFWTIN